MKLGKEILTSGQVAMLLGCAVKTVNKWIDAGDLPGHQLPKTQARRVYRADLVRFCKERGLTPPFPGDYSLICTEDKRLLEATAFVRLHGEWQLARHWVEAAIALGRGRPRLVLVDLAMGRVEGLQLITAVRQEYDPGVRIIGLANEDGSIAELADAGCTSSFQRPLDFQQILDALQEIDA